MQHYLPESGPSAGPFSLEKARAVCAKVYGNPDVCDPAFTYDPPEAKAIPAIWHHDRGMIVDSLVLCDYENTRVFSMLSEDGAADTALMAKLFSAATGCRDQRSANWTARGSASGTCCAPSTSATTAAIAAIDETTLDGFMYPGKDDGVMLDRGSFLGAAGQLLSSCSGWNPRQRLAHPRASWRSWVWPTWRMGWSRWGSWAEHALSGRAWGWNPQPGETQTH